MQKACQIRVRGRVQGFCLKLSFVSGDSLAAGNPQLQV